MTASLLAASIAVALADIPATMRAVKVTKLTGCKKPDFSCLQVEENVATPKPNFLEPVLIRVNSSSVNPSDVDLVGTPAGYLLGTLGNDISGTVVECSGCKRFKVGDAVWGTLAGGAYADYRHAGETLLGLKPSNLDPIAAGTIPEVGMTSMQCLKKLQEMIGKPKLTNLTVVVTSGSGGTGFIGIQLAKAYGAAKIITATSGADNIAFVKSIGADVVTDYKKVDIFDSLANDSVDVVYDNIGLPGTADKALRTIRAGGAYLILTGGGKGNISPNSKAGVQQHKFGLMVPSVKDLDELKTLFESDSLKPHVEKSFPLVNIRDAFAFDASGQVVGKIAVTA